MRWSALGLGIVGFAGVANGDLITPPYDWSEPDAGRRPGFMLPLALAEFDEPGLFDDPALDVDRSRTANLVVDSGLTVRWWPEPGGDLATGLSKELLEWPTLRLDGLSWPQAARGVWSEVPIIIDRTEDAKGSVVPWDAPLALGPGIGPGDLPK
jgi:hypothetical protein